MAEEEDQSSLNERWDQMVGAVFHRSRIMPNREWSLNYKITWSRLGAHEWLEGS